MTRPISAAQAVEWANGQTGWFSTSSGHIELAITRADAKSGSHSGRCDEDIAELLRVPYIKEQIDLIGPDLLASELKEYGAWDETELADHAQNKARILWLACGDIAEGRG